MTHAAIDAFASALASRGIRPGTIRADGRVHRCGTEKKPRGTNGAYCLYLDQKIPAGWFQNHEDGEGVTRWHADKVSNLTAAERLALRRKIEAQRQERQKAERLRQAKAAERANCIWDSIWRNRQAHDYLRRKNIESHGARTYRGMLTIPLYDACGEITNLQFIAADGAKRFLLGGRKRGCFYALGWQRAVMPSHIFIGEGFSTMASVREATGQLCVVAFDCGNLLPVASVWHRKLPEARIVICADNDAPGRSAAEATAAAVPNCTIALPPCKGDDFNDMQDPEEIRTILRDALRRKTPCGADVG